MTVKQFNMPRGASKPLTMAGAFTTEWHQYFGGIELLSKRVAASIEPIPAPSNAAENKINELIAALKAAQAMET